MRPLVVGDCLMSRRRPSGVGRPPYDKFSWLNRAQDVGYPVFVQLARPGPDPRLHAGEAICVKSPRSVAAVGTKEMFAAGATDSYVP